MIVLSVDTPDREEFAGVFWATGAPYPGMNAGAFTGLRPSPGDGTLR